jgi:hypothetical protein
VQDDGRILIDAGALIPGRPAPPETAAPTTAAAETSTPAPEPPTPTPTTEPQSLEGFLGNLQQALNGRDFGDLEEQMRPIFVTGIYPAATGTAASSEVIPHLESRLLPIEPDVDIYEVDAATLPDSLTAETLFDEEAPDIAVIGSSGWGLAGSGAGLLYIVEEENAYRWAGLVVAYEDFTPLPALETVASPPGLVYQIESFQYEWWRVSAEGEPESLIRRNAELSLNPDATLALQAEVNEQSVTLFHRADGNSETISLDETLMIDSGRVRWLDERTAVLAIANGPVSQGTRGQLALLDTTTGRLTILDAEVDSYVQPSVTEGGAIIASTHRPGQVLRWQDGEAEIITLADLADQDKSLVSPVPSPDGSSVAFATGSDSGQQPWAYAVAGLDQPGYTVLHTFTAVPTDAVIPWGITWSPDGRWLTLSPQSWDAVESGAWLVAADGSNKVYLGPGSGNVVWLDAERFVFSAVLDGKAGLQLYDVTSGERFWLNRPTFEVEGMFSGFWLDIPATIAAVQCVC